MKSDIEIAREVSLRKIKEIATGSELRQIHRQDTYPSDRRREDQTTQSYPGYSHHSDESGYR